MTKQIHTTISDELWKLAMNSDISWTRALEVGIKAISGVGENKEKKE